MQTDSSLALTRKSLELTQELFNIQNRPYVDIARVIDGSNLDLITDEHHFGCEIFLFNSGNLPAIVKGISCIIRFEQLQVDCTLNFITKIYPRQDDFRKIEFRRDLSRNFGEEIKRQYPLFKNEYHKYLTTILIVKYESVDLNLVDSSKSVWENQSKSNHLTRIE